LGYFLVFCLLEKIKHKHCFSIPTTSNMPTQTAILKIDFHHRVEQQVVKEGARNSIAPSYPQVERIPGFSCEMVLLQKQNKIR
jgi:hypothetical protein